MTITQAPPETGKPASAKHDPRDARLADTMTVFWLTRRYPDLPVPFTGPDRAALYFIDKAAREAREAVEAAKRVFAEELGVTFTRRNARHSNGLRAIFWAELDGGLLVELVVKAEHVDVQDTPGLAEPSAA